MRSIRRVLVAAPVILFALAAGLWPAEPGYGQGKPKAYTASIPSTDAFGNPLTPAQASANSTLATFPYTVVSTRDGKSYSGVMVGESPFGSNFSTTTITTPIIPVILTTHRIATKADPNGSVIATTQGTTVFDPMAADPCLSSPNNVPFTLMEQSPLFEPTDFKFGNTKIGTTQYIDAFQRANFWQFVGGTNYHTILDPQIYPAVSIDIPGDQGFAIPANLPVPVDCGPEAVVNIDYMSQQVLPRLLASEGVNPSQFPIFLFHNTVLTLSAYKGFYILGYHSAIVSPTFNGIRGQGPPGAPVQTYAFIDFETSGFFDPFVPNTSIAAHEIGEWMDDPFVNNPTPAWGHSGQQAGCQSNLEVGDPLTGTDVIVNGSNGFAYHLQELAFFSWFYGGPSIAANGWFSDNNTFTSDAGSVCTKH